jgi:hypothetical protein
MKTAVNTLGNTTPGNNCGGGGETDDGKREGGKAAVCTPEAVRHEREISNPGR